jgi:hypothetical protein
VDSAILLLEHRTGDDAFTLSPHDEERLWRLVQAGFRERRKKLRNALPRALPILESDIIAALERANLSPDQRAQTLSVQDWIALLAELPELDAGVPTNAARAAVARRSASGGSAVRERTTTRSLPAADPTGTTSSTPWWRSSKQATASIYVERLTEQIPFGSLVCR